MAAAGRKLLIDLGQQAGDPLGIQLAKQRIGSSRKTMELACGGVVRARLDSPALRN
jgi:hypothetical protein